MTGPTPDLAAVIRQARSALAGYGTGSGTARTWAPVLADRLRDLLAAVGPVPAAVDRDAMPLRKALREIGEFFPVTAYIAGGWLRGERTDPVDDVMELLRTLPDDVGSARNVLVAAVRAREARHATESGSDGDR